MNILPPPLSLSSLSLKTTSTAILLAFTLGLSGCGGTGGGNGRMMNDDIERSDDEPLQTLSKIYQAAITDGADYTFDNVMSAAVVQNLGNEETSISGTPDLSVSSIARNNEGGYDITYRIDDATDTVTFLPEHCDEAERVCNTNLAEGGGVSIWSMHSTVEGLLGPSDLAEYHNAKHNTFNNVLTNDGMNLRHRQIFVFGVTTPDANQPEMGIANYYGWFFGYAYQNDASSNAFRQRISGDFRLVANFGPTMPVINGEITNIRGQAPGQGSEIQTPWPNSSFVITGTGINSAGQFTAKLEGKDESSDPDIASLRKFMGALTAQLFGPNADEIGGVISADRDGTDHDLSLYGYISGTKFSPAKMIGSDGVLVGISRNYRDDITEPKERGAVIITRGDSGWTVIINDRSWNLDDSESNGTIYEHAVDTDDDAAYLWSTTDGFKSTSEFEYFDVKGWADNSQGDGIWSTYYMIHGDRTGDSALPASTASYQGRMEARAFPRDDAVNFSDAERFRGDLSLTADFAEAQVIGNITNLENRVDGSAYVSVTGSAIFNATIDGHDFAANEISGTGDLSDLHNGNVYGSFFGSTAQEAGGVFDAELGNDLIIGYFGTTQEN